MKIMIKKIKKIFQKFNNLPMSKKGDTMSESQFYYPGNEPVSTDDLIFQIGEKEIDLYRKRKAINTLKEQIEILLKTNQELNEELSKYKNNE